MKTQILILFLAITSDPVFGGSSIIRLHPTNMLSATSFAVKVVDGEFGKRFTVFQKTNGYTLNEFLEGRLEVSDEDHQIASSNVEKKWTTNGVQFEFVVSTNYLLASKFTIIEMAHSGKIFMAGFDAHWFYLRDFGTNIPSTPGTQENSDVVSSGIINELPSTVRDLAPGIESKEVWNRLRLAPYRHSLGGEVFGEHERRWLNWNYEIELSFEPPPDGRPNFDRDKLKLIRVTLYKNGIEVSRSRP